MKQLKVAAILAFVVCAGYLLHRVDIKAAEAVVATPGKAPAWVPSVFSFGGTQTSDAEAQPQSEKRFQPQLGVDPKDAIKAVVSSFGADLDGNGVPDRLDRFIDTWPTTEETKGAGRRYYRIHSELSAKAALGMKLDSIEKEKFWTVLNCAVLSAYDDGFENLPDLDTQFQMDREAYHASKMLENAMNGMVAEVARTKTRACSK